MDKKQIHNLCSSGAFDAFMELANAIEVSEVKYTSNPHDIAYQLGKRDGAMEFKDELYSLVRRNATE